MNKKESTTINKFMRIQETHKVSTCVRQVQPNKYSDVKRELN